VPEKSPKGEAFWYFLVPEIFASKMPTLVPSVLWRCWFKVFVRDPHISNGITSNGITCIRANLLVVKSIRPKYQYHQSQIYLAHASFVIKKWFNRDLNWTVVWICPSLTLIFANIASEFRYPDVESTG